MPNFDPHPSKVDSDHFQVGSDHFEVDGNKCSMVTPRPWLFEVPVPLLNLRIQFSIVLKMFSHTALVSHVVLFNGFYLLISYGVCKKRKYFFIFYSLISVFSLRGSTLINFGAFLKEDYWYMSFISEFKSSNIGKYNYFKKNFISKNDLWSIPTKLNSKYHLILDH